MGVGTEAVDKRRQADVMISSGWWEAKKVRAPPCRTRHNTRPWESPALLGSLRAIVGTTATTLCRIFAFFLQAVPAVSALLGSNDTDAVPNGASGCRSDIHCGCELYNQNNLPRVFAGLPSGQGSPKSEASGPWTDIERVAQAGFVQMSVNPMIPRKIGAPPSPRRGTLNSAPGMGQIAPGCFDANELYLVNSGVHESRPQS
ncbi:hypothetical protein WOLCODRAFT_155253 [Wolfiporia cocos MD-104 SS10]|uniref:Uncharacterized protein n=1 Tax=Wolfiporia cocos (strain MD-104) TaxID=742152 RepID=A0A2H3IXB3_WOLCO|nr:hypothetical protein WOLCODRAFT_155253 [Wolfiporia cocos MD-104 SS10]